MLISRRCAYAKADGQPCRMAPLHDRPYCFSHDPERAEEAAEARRIGGLRRKKERTIAVAYDLPGLDTVAGIRRLLEIVVIDGIGLENGIARLRVLISTRWRRRSSSKRVSSRIGSPPSSRRSAWAGRRRQSPSPTTRYDKRRPASGQGRSLAVADRARRPLARRGPMPSTTSPPTRARSSRR